MSGTRGPGTPGGTPERPAIFFADVGQWRAWLATNHASAPDLWMGLRKQHVSNRGLTWADAVVEALCFGWIDSQVQRIDDDAVRQRWTPRRPGSTWSGVNLDTVGRLIAEGRMAPAGLAAYERRRVDRQRIYSFEQDVVAFPAGYEERLRAHPAARVWWDLATPGYRKLATHWVTSAKQEATRERRLTQLIEDSAAGRLIPSQRYGPQPAWVTRARIALGLPDR